MRSEVVLTPWDASWSVQFETEARRLREALGPVVVDVVHVGSTSVEGLCARPTLDVTLVVDSLAAFPRCFPILAALGYARRPDFEPSWSDGPVLTREAPPALPITLHVGTPTSRTVSDTRAFRDALRADAALRDEYEALERRLATAHGHDPRAYVEAKTPFVRRVLGPPRFVAAPSCVAWPGPRGPLEVRLGRPDDAPALVEAVRESLPALRRHLPWAHLESNQTVEGQRTRLAGTYAAGRAGEQYVFHVWQGQREPRLVGSVGLYRGRSLNPDALELGYWIRTSQTGRGLARSAGRAMVALAFEVLAADRVHAVLNAANTASARVAEACGLSSEATLTRWEGRPTPEQAAAGMVLAEESTIARALPADRAGWAWYGPLRDALTIDP